MEKMTMQEKRELASEVGIRTSSTLIRVLQLHESVFNSMLLAMSYDGQEGSGIISNAITKNLDGALFLLACEVNDYIERLDYVGMSIVLNYLSEGMESSISEYMERSKSGNCVFSSSHTMTREDILSIFLDRIEDMAMGGNNDAIALLKKIKG